MPLEMNGRKYTCRKCGADFILRLKEQAAAPPEPPGERPRPAPPAATVQAFNRQPAATVPVLPEDRKTPAVTVLAADASQPAPSVSDGKLDWNIGDIVLELYEVTGLLGEGGMGRVYKVRHRDWGVDLAVKVPKPDILAAVGGAENFEREAETWVNLGLHPHSASCYYVRRIGGLPCVFAEFVSGGSLHDWIAGQGDDLPPLYRGGPRKALARIMDIAVQFAWGLKYAHEQGLVHLDVKPANVLISAEGLAKVTDFGLARAKAGPAGDAGADSSESEKQEKKQPAGTREYFSPEQAAGRPLDQHSDMWSWALCLLEMFKGGRTWEFGSVGAAVLKEYLEAGVSASWLPPMPPELAEILTRCFHEEPQLRPADMGEVAGSLVEAFRQITGQDYKRSEPASGAATADSLNNQAVSLLDLGRLDEAKKLWDKALTAQPHHPESTYNQGLQFWREGRINDDALIESIIESSRSFRGLWTCDYYRALIHLERGDCQSALELLRSLPDEDAAREEVAALRVRAEADIAGSNRLTRIMKGHASNVNGVAVARDGSLAVSASDDRNVGVWNLESGALTAMLTGHGGSVNSVAMDQSSRLVLSGGGDFASRDYVLLLWDLKEMRLVRELKGHQKKVNSVCLSHDGRLAASGGDDRTVRFWDTLTGEEIAQWTAHEGPVRAVCFSRDARNLFSGGADHKVKVWDVDSRNCLRTLEGHTGQINSLAVGLTKRYVVSAASDRTLRLWDLATGRCERVMSGHRAEINAVSVSDDHSFALSCGSDRTLKLWELASGRCLRTFEGHESWVLSSAMAGQAPLAVSGSVDSSMRIWKVNPGERNFTAPMVLSRVSTSELIVSAGETYEMHLNQAQEALKQGRASVAAEHLKEARSQPGYDRGTEAVRIWSALYLHLPRSGFRSGWETGTMAGHGLDVTALAVTPNGRHVVSGSADKTLKIWGAADGSGLSTLRGHQGDVTSICFEPEGVWLVSAGEDATIRQWDLKTGLCLRVIEANGGRINALLVTPDGQYILSGGEDMIVRIWDAATGVSLGELTGHRSPVNSLAVSLDGRAVLTASGGATGEDSLVRLWDMATGNLKQVISGHERPVNRVCFSPDGNTAYSASSDKTIKAWRLSDASCLRTYTGHAGAVNALALSTDGRFLLSGGYDRTVRLWEAGTGACLRVFEGHSAPVLAVSFSPDGCYAVSGGADNLIKIWTLDWSLDSPPLTGWEESADVWLKAFLRTREGFIPLAGPEQKSEPVSWADGDLKQLLYTLACAGYGWLAPADVSARLQALSGRPLGANEPAGPAAESGTDGAAVQKQTGWWSAFISRLRGAAGK